MERRDRDRSGPPTMQAVSSALRRFRRPDQTIYLVRAQLKEKMGHLRRGLSRLSERLRGEVLGRWERSMKELK